MIGASLVTWVAGFAACWPVPLTGPAVTSSAACSRDLARPRLTSSASSRTRVTLPLPRLAPLPPVSARALHGSHPAPLDAPRPVCPLGWRDQPLLHPRG